MGYYIQAPTNHNKAQYLVDDFFAEIVPQPATFEDVPAEIALICVVDNGGFEAAGLCYDGREFEEFSDSTDNRRKTWVMLDKPTAHQLARYPR